jgi:CBS domain containing-hemolysin-like protein
VTLAIAIVALFPLLVLRVLAAAAAVTIASGVPLRWRSLDADVLASAARATSQVAGATIVGIVCMLVWHLAGRGFIPIVLALTVPTVLILADLVPRGLAAEVSRRTRWLAPIMAAMAVVLAPLLLAERGLARLLGMRGQSHAFRALRRLGGWLDAQQRREPLDVSEPGVVARIARFTGRTAHDAMVPHVGLCAVPDTASVGDVVALVRERGFSRLPVFHERLFNTIGIVSSLDLLGVVDPALPVTGVMRDPLFVPESKPLPELLAMLQAEGCNAAIVVDEYGGAVGLVTVEDLVEEIVGDIEDEYDVPKELYRRVAPGVFVLSARAPVADVNERFAWNLPQGEYETVGGLVLERLGRVPKPGDVLVAGRVHIEVTRATARAVQEVRVTEHAPGA